MTQDPYGQPPGSGYVVRGEVVPDDEANVTPLTTPMTHFQKVASALHADRTDPAIPVHQEADPADPGVPDAEASEETGRDADATHAGEVGAVRSPDDDESRDYWDEADAAGRDEAAAAAAPQSAPAAAAGTWPARPDGQDPTATQPDPWGEFSELTYGSLLPDAAEFKTRWQQVQFRFVDDPQGSVAEAADVIAQVTARLEAAIAERQRALRDRWSEGKSTDTESLRETLLMYRAFLDQLTGPKAG